MTRLYFLFGALILMPQFFAQKNLKVDLINKFTLENPEYFNFDISFKISNGLIYYLQQSNNRAELYCKSMTSKDETKLHSIQNFHIAGGYIYDFDIDVENGTIVYLLGDEFVLFNYNFEDTTSTNYSEGLIIKLKDYDLDKIVLTKNKIIVGSCYNNVNSLNGNQASCFVHSFSRDSTKLIASAEFIHDAIALTHLPNKFYDIKGNQAVFIKAMSDDFSIFELRKDGNIGNYGSNKKLNKRYDSIPFSTKIDKGVNAKAIVREVSEFSGKINRNESIYYINDTTILTILKTASKKMGSKRILSLWEKSSNTSKWILKSRKKFKNNLISKNYFTLNFHYSTELVFYNEKLYYIGLDLPLTAKNKKAYDEHFEKNQNPKFAIYEYKVLWD